MPKETEKTSSTIAKPVLAYKAVSQSPFKNQEVKKDTNSFSNSINTTKTNGTGKIGDRFLSQINQNKQTNGTSKETSPTKVENQADSNSTSPQSNQSNQEIAPVSTQSPPTQTQSTYSNGHSQQAYNPPINNYKETNDEDDEWGENASELKILPTTSAPIATFNDDYHDDYQTSVDNYSNSEQNVNINNNYTNQISNEQFDAHEQVNLNTNQQTSNITAIALYDYQATDSDEISFDPNDTITDIVQVNRILIKLF